MNVKKVILWLHDHTGLAFWLAIGLFYFFYSIGDDDF